MSVFQHLGSDEPPRLCHWEGFVPLSRHYCLRLFRRGEVRLRDFPGREVGRRFQLPHSAEDLIVTVPDLVILEKDRLKWEERWNAAKLRRPAASAPVRPVEAMPSFRRFRIGGEEHQFGMVQATALRLLYGHALRGRPWCNGKQLLHEAGSQSYTLSNLFKRKPVWRELIRSDGRGYYRLDEAVLLEIRRRLPMEADPALPPGTPPPPPPPPPAI